MDWSSLASNVAALAPGIGAAIGGPVGAVAGLGVKALCSLFGVEASADDAVGKVAQALNGMTPEQAVALKQLDQQFIKDMRALDVDVFRLEVDDRKSARAENKSSTVPGWLSAIIVAGWVVLMWALFKGRVPPDSRELVSRALGTADAALMAVIYFWFGSSYGSARKTELGAKQ